MQTRNPRPLGGPLIVGLLVSSLLVACSSTVPQPTRTTTASRAPSPAPTVAPTPAPTASPPPRTRQEVDFAYPFSVVWPGELRPDQAMPHDRIAAVELTEAASDADDRRGIWALVAEPGWIHGCIGANTRVDLGNTPVAALATMRDRGALSLSPAAEVMVDGRPALMAELGPSGPPCRNELHPGDEPGGLAGFAVRLDKPARIIAFEVQETTLILLLWADTPEGLEGWLPAAMEAVDSIRFEVRD